jgi:hypothetical protein
VNVIQSFQRHDFIFEKFLCAKEKKTIHLRHDIDFSIEAAYQLAIIESELGVTATYFFMLTSNMYNLISDNNQKVVKEIESLGHNITLHFDPAAHSDIDKGFKAEKMLFEEIFDLEIDIVSIHRPGAFLENNNRKLEGCRHTYEDAFFKDIMYISDSGGRDIQQRLLDLAEAGSCVPLHILFHPIWWTSRTPSPTVTLNNWLYSHLNFLTNETRRSCKTYGD